MPHLLLCLTPGNRLATWQRAGTLRRELRPYLAYVEHGWEVKILTFGREQASYFGLPHGISLAYFPHTRLLPWLGLLRPDLGRWADIVKTNQSALAWYYTTAARQWRKPIVLRAGYVAGKNYEHEHGLSPQIQTYQTQEAQAFQTADHCILTTDELAAWVSDRYHVERAHLTVIPNFVDTALFAPDRSQHRGSTHKARSVIAVGRLNPVKRLDLLIDACGRAHVNHLTLVGTGPESERLQQLAQANGLPLILAGQVPNERLPALLREHTVFAQLSSWEGHPKTLIEAMACGSCCLVADAPGLTNQVTHGENAWVVEADVSMVAAALDHLLADARSREKLSAAARATACARFSFEKLFEQELKIMKMLVRRSGVAP